MSLGNTISGLWMRFQGDLFPRLAEAVGPLCERHRKFVMVLECVAVERFVSSAWMGPGRPSKDRRALARAFIARSVWNLQSTRALIDRLMVDTCLRRLCGWQRRSEIPSESTFSRAFADFRDGMNKRAITRLARSRWTA